MTTATTVAEFRNEPPLDFSNPATVAEFQAALDRVRQQLGRTYPLIIGGQEVVGDETFESTNPAHPAEVIGKHVHGTAEHAQAAVEAAVAAFPDWSRRPPAERAEVLFRAADRVIERRHELSALLIYEVGKPWEEADGETAETADLLRWYAHQMLRLANPTSLTPLEGEETSYFYVPLGAGVVISPWNFPLALTAGMASAAIVAGNSVVIKPASASATAVAWLVDILRETGVPDGVVNYITGPGGDVGDALIDHPRVRFIAFTGSKEVGLRIYERAARIGPGQMWLKRTQLEMGGKNGVIVDETADLDVATEAIVESAFGFQGQKCSAGSRAIIVDAVYDDLLQRVVDRTRKLVVGDPREPRTQVGPLIDENAFRKVFRYLDVGRDEGRLLAGGEQSGSEGYYVQPVIFADVSPDARIAQEEIFGPVLTAIRARDFDDALRIANATEYGLTGALISQDQDHVASAVEQFHVGNLYVNRKCTGALMGVHPFGGFNMSGTDSKAGGPDYLLLFLQGKSVGARRPSPG